jgi:TBC1 domain family member 13
LFFFQRATEFPCEEIKNASSAANGSAGSAGSAGEEHHRYQSLRKRVANTQLKADAVSKNRLGYTFFKSDPKKKEDQGEYAYLPDGQEAHWEIVQRILFIFAKLNKGQSYVQGM